MAVGAEVALLEPSVFVAFTTTRSVFPTSAAVATRVLSVAPATFEQLFPAGLQRSHW